MRSTQSNRLLAIVAENNETLDRVFTEFTPLAKHFADTRDLFADAVQAIGRISTAADDALAPASDNIHTNLASAATPAARAGQGLAVPDRCAEDCCSPRRSTSRTCRKSFAATTSTCRSLVDLTLSAIDNGLVVRHRCLRHAARARAVVGPRSGHDDPGRAVHAEPARRTRTGRWSKGVSEA